MRASFLFFCRFGPYFVSPVIAGLEDKTHTPYLCGMDTIGAIETAHDFMVAGTAPDSLYGRCESMYRPDMVRAPSHPRGRLLLLGKDKGGGPLSVIFHGECNGGYRGYNLYCPFREIVGGYPY